MHSLSDAAEVRPQTSPRFHVLLDRDVGLFSLVQQAISHIPWALSEGRIPIAAFGAGCVYWTANGYQGGDNVWEYYFEPIHPEFPARSLPPNVLAAELPGNADAPVTTPDGHVLARNFGDHPSLKGKTLPLSYSWKDPTRAVRRKAAQVIDRHIRVRSYISERVERFIEQELKDSFVVGVHIRGTDAALGFGDDVDRRGSLHYPTYVRAISRIIRRRPDARIFVATDSHESLRAMENAFPGRVSSMSSVRDTGASQTVGLGPTGWGMPGYLVGNPDLAAQNGADAIAEWLVLCRANHLVHNASSLARTVLLANPSLPHTNTFPKRRSIVAYYQALAAQARTRRVLPHTWLRVTNGAIAGLRVPSRHSLKVYIEAPGPERWDVQLNLIRQRIDAGRTYRLVCEVRSDEARQAAISVAHNGGNWEDLCPAQTVELTPRWRGFVYQFQASAATESSRIHFDLGDAAVAVEIRNVELTLDDQQRP